MQHWNITGRGFDRVLAPCWAPLRSGLGQATYASPSSIIWYRPMGEGDLRSSAGKVAAGLVESNGS